MLLILDQDNWVKRFSPTHSQSQAIKFSLVLVLNLESTEKRMYIHTDFKKKEKRKTLNTYRTHLLHKDRTSDLSQVKWELL